MRKLPLSFILLLSAVVPLSGQLSDPQEIFRSDIDNIASAYFEAAGEYSSVYYGIGQVVIPKHMEVTYLRLREIKKQKLANNRDIPDALRIMDEYGEGVLLYDGVRYPAIRIRYDIFSDQLILQKRGMTGVVVLNPYRVGYADLHGYRFVYIPAGSYRNSITPGYYRQIYDGRHVVLQKETLSVSQLDFSNEVVSGKYYILKDGIFHNVGKQKQLFDMFPEHKTALRQYLRARGTDFRKETAAAVVAAAEYYDSLTEW